MKPALGLACSMMTCVVSSVHPLSDVTDNVRLYCWSASGHYTSLKERFGVESFIAEKEVWTVVSKLQAKVSPFPWLLLDISGVHGAHAVTVSLWKEAKGVGQTVTVIEAESLHPVPACTMCLIL